MVARRGAAAERTQTAACPNGRALTNDVFTARVAFLTSGKAGSGGLRPHGGLLAEFPFPARRIPNPKLRGLGWVNPQRSRGFTQYQRRCGGRSRTKLTGDGQQQHRTTGNLDE